ncbi:hypothetical protein BgAZ_209350 [Babesia gibsoni]|uniref:Uncharacterized protein n=1 Tax=Babesia gibsoni TaxID=33632 RepID=A0AAD8UV07_BABGI|nr:hypothetical protein BgAZ_209350 [Babesia gibsoni]
MALFRLFWALLLTVTSPPCLSDTDLKSLEREQQLLLNNIQQSKIESAKLQEQLNNLHQSKAEESNTLNVSNVVVDNNEGDEEKDKVETGYSAPVIVILPEESSQREKWEYAITLRCLGQKDFSGFQQLHNSKLLEMSTIKGKTVEEIKQEMKDTEKELEKTKAELPTLEAALPELKDNSYSDRTKKMHLLHNIKLVKHEIDVLNTKLERLKKRLKAAMLFSSKYSKEKDEDDESTHMDEDEELEEEGEEDDEGQADEADDF